jgi:hypothetical protein
MLIFMTKEAGQAILVDLQGFWNKAKITLAWKLTWLEKKIVTIPPANEKIEQEQPQGKCKKLPNNEKSTPNKEQRRIHHTHKQQATKVLSEAATSNERRIQQLEKSLAALQEDNVDLKSTIGEMKDIQHREQAKMIGMQLQMTETNWKTEAANQDIRKCKLALHSVETKMATLSTTEETNNRFDRIESLLTGVPRPLISLTLRYAGTMTVTGKRKEQARENDAGDDKDFADSRQIMEVEDNDTNKEKQEMELEGTDNHTNSPKENNTQQVQLK